MARSQSAGPSIEQWLTAAAALAVGAAFFALWFWLLPGWLGFRSESCQDLWDGDGWGRCRRYWDSPLRCAAFGTSDGRDAELLRLWLRRNDWWWWASTAMCGTRCTWASQLAGLDCGLCSGILTSVAICIATQ